MFINQITFRDKPTQHFKTPIANEGSYILYYAYIKPNFKKKIWKYEHQDEYGFYRKKESGFFSKLTIDYAIKKHGAENILKTSDGRLRGFKIRPDEEVDFKQNLSSIWTDIQQNNITYPTQKPYKLLERIICLSTV